MNERQSAWLRVARSFQRACRSFVHELRESVSSSKNRELDQRDVEIRISRGWATRCRSRFAMLAWVCLGLSVSFAPLYLVWYGEGREPLFGLPRVVGVPVCYVTILLPGLFFGRLGLHVCEWVRRRTEP